MNISENLFVCVAEEGAEIAQASDKILRFSKERRYPPNLENLTNEGKLLKEYYQLVAVVEYMQSNGYLKCPDKIAIERLKQDKIANMLDHQIVSVDEGTLTL